MINFLARSLLTFAAVATLAKPVLAEDMQVKIDNFTFNPQQITVIAGTKVTWTNADDIPHTVTSPPAFRSRALDTDDEFSFTFTTPGTYRYFCGLHPHMTGSIVVEGTTGDAAPQ